MPKISIITINYNNDKGLAKTIASVMLQTFTDYEYIIVDGGSTDESVEVIKKHCSKITYWVSEKDKGIYNAMNKGILKASGEYCYFLNSGDCLWAPDTLQKVFEAGSNAEIIYGNSINEESSQICYSCQSLTLNYFFSGTIFHQAAFIKRSLFDKLGLYNEHLKVVSDWEFFLKAIILQRSTYLYMNTIIASFEKPGMSGDDYTSNERERHAILQRLFPLYYEDYIKMRRLACSDLSDFYKSIEHNRYLKFIVRSLLSGRNVFNTVFRK